MSKAEFKGLTTFKQWKGKLDELLGVAHDLSEVEELQPRRDLAERLTEFQEFSPDEADIQELDAITEQAREGIVLGTIDQRVGAISAASSALSTLQKQLDRQAEEDRQAASAIRLEGLRGTLKSVNDTVTAAMDLEKRLLDGED